MLKPAIVIIEEASEILESHVLAAITKDTKQIIMIGDHHQLRPHINSIQLQRKFDFDISLYERLIMNDFPHVTLDVQMRMRPEFCDLIRNEIYKNLKDGENVKNYQNVNGMTRNFFCLTHDHPESSSDTSKENLFEVDFIVNLYKKLISVGNATEDIVILTPYIAQAKRFTEKLKQLNLPKARVAVLDSYQGEESNIILLSLVRSNKNNEIGFLNLANRICVLLSRAKIGFYICANIECLAGASKLWKNVKEILIKHGALSNEVPSDLVIARSRLSSRN
jgi:superfamily I DNA and/or RNA helicase